jgi:hypothetical protein
MIHHKLIQDRGTLVYFLITSTATLRKRHVYQSLVLSSQETIAEFTLTRRNTLRVFDRKEINDILSRRVERFIFTSRSAMK